MNKNIALVVYYNKTNKYSFNALVGAVEADGYFGDLKIYFFKTESELVEQSKEILDSHPTVIIGISFFSTQLWEISSLVKQLKEKYVNKVIYVAGGPHPTGDSKGTLKMGFDVVVIGEGEETFPDLLRAIDDDRDWSNIKGIAYIDDKGEYHYTGRRPLIDLNDYPPFAVMHKKFGPIEISRGCPYVCYFCQTPILFGVHPRHRSIERIYEYVSIMKIKGLTDIRFITPNSFSYGSRDGKELNIEALEDLLKSVRGIIKERGKIFMGSFPSEVRPEHVTETTINLILKYANNRNLVIGGQSGSQRILDSCHRGHSVEEIYRAVKLTLKAGLEANVDFIFGLPGENDNDVRETVKVMHDLVKMGARIHTHTFMPLPQTPFAKASAGVIDEKLRSIVNELVSKDKAYGNWIEQERITKKITKYLRDGKL